MNAMSTDFSLSDIATEQADDVEILNKLPSLVDLHVSSAFVQLAIDLWCVSEQTIFIDIITPRSQGVPSFPSITPFHHLLCCIFDICVLGVA